ncbi:hypothetical protein KI387_036782, partial [Taxus chinensis]
TSYVDRLISDIISMKPISLAIEDIGAMLRYLQIKPKIENKKYMENEFALPGPPNGKHTVENMPAPKPTKDIEVDDEEEEREDSGDLEHRG